MRPFAVDADGDAVRGRDGDVDVNLGDVRVGGFARGRATPRRTRTKKRSRRRGFAAFEPAERAKQPTTIPPTRGRRGGDGGGGRLFPVSGGTRGGGGDDG